jgi:L-threonylcarbamoyladenylate synthase
MEIVAKHELHSRKKDIIKKIKEGGVFIHPTDTIYGLGCDALNEAAVKKIRKLKDRHDTPFSVWIPSQDWIKQNCQHSPALNKWLKELPGAYTLIVKLKNKKCVAPNVNPSNQTLGIRMPHHWLHNLINELDFPIVTTSANKTGKSFMTSLEDMDPEIKRSVDFIIYEGEKKARPSKIINLIEEERVIER